MHQWLALAIMVSAVVHTALGNSTGFIMKTGGSSGASRQAVSKASGQSLQDVRLGVSWRELVHFVVV